MNCSFFNNENQFKIINESQFEIDSLSIVPDSRNLNTNLKVGESKLIKTELGKIKTDGSFHLSFINSKTKEKFHKNFGYFTNGIANDYLTIITIKNDTILIKSEFK
ncbi:hypothetical protein ACFQ1Q_08740 [Winogradskyella litorisediminis]|uniref:Uncharacterized protein n=1 Tax=Winogradskyella litorisediminis TaxID=1156618 RepID=A0ABW3N6N1_9FLAO